MALPLTAERKAGLARHDLAAPPRIRRALHIAVPRKSAAYPGNVGGS